jgi:hypothetical protein
MLPTGEERDWVVQPTTVLTLSLARQSSLLWRYGPTLVCSFGLRVFPAIVWWMFHWIRPDFRFLVQIWRLVIGCYGNRSNSEDVLQQIDAPDWDKSDSNDEFSSDEVDYDSDYPNAITQYRMPYQPTPPPQAPGSPLEVQDMDVTPDSAPGSSVPPGPRPRRHRSPTSPYPSSSGSDGDPAGGGAMDGGSGSLICPIILSYIDQINDRLQIFFTQNNSSLVSTGYTTIFWHIKPTIGEHKVQVKGEKTRIFCLQQPS